MSKKFIVLALYLFMIFINLAVAFQNVEDWRWVPGVAAACRCGLLALWEVVR